MNKIDIHLHLTDRDAPQGGNISSGAQMIPHLDELGIGFGILMSGGEQEEAVCSNASCIRVCEAFPDRYAWMCNVEERDEETLFDRLRRYQASGAVGVGELMMNVRLDHLFLKALFCAAERLGMPVLFHMSPEEGFGYGVADEPGLPLLEETLRRYPALAVIGHSQPFWHEVSGEASLEREARNTWGSGPVAPGGRLVELFEKYPNLYGDLSANSGGCAVMRDEAFGLAFLERFKDRLMFGTDMVHAGMEFPLGAWLDEMAAKEKLPEDAYEAICRKNAIRLFHLKERKGLR